MITVPTLLPTARRAWQRIWDTYVIFSEIDAEQRAAAFAYYAIFALIPLLTLLLSLGSMFFDPNDVKRVVFELIPSGSPGQETLWKMVDDLQRVRGGVSLISILILAWSSLKFFQALVRAVNRAWHTEEFPWWQLPLKNLAMIGVITSGLALGILLPAILQGVVKALTAFEHFVLEHIPAIHLAPLFTVLDFSRYLVGGLVLLYAIGMLYTFAPRRRAPLRYVWAPALVVTITLQLSQIALVNYLPRFVNYGVLYGSIGGLMLFLFWIYLIGLVIITGACFSAALARPVGDGASPVAKT